MKSYYYINEQNEKTGPVAHAALLDLHQQGKITGNTPVMTEGAVEATPFQSFSFTEYEFPGNASTPGESAPSAPAVAEIPSVSATSNSGGNNDSASLSPKKSDSKTWIYVTVGSVVIAIVLLFILGSLMLQEASALLTGIFDNVQTKHVSSIVYTELNKNPEARQLLGDNIRVLEIPGQRLTYDIPTKTATGQLSVKGSKAEGILTVTREQGKAKTSGFHVLLLEVDGKTYDLLKVKPSP